MDLFSDRVLLQFPPVFGSLYPKFSVPRLDLRYPLDDVRDRMLLFPSLPDVNLIVLICIGNKCKLQYLCSFSAVYVHISGVGILCSTFACIVVLTEMALGSAYIYIWVSE